MYRKQPLFSVQTKSSEFNSQCLHSINNGGKGKMEVTRHGFKSPTIAIVGGVHGNEPIGVKAIRKLKHLDIKGSMKFIVANEKALQLQQRFVKVDLNRSFPGNKKGKYEERLAYTILKELEGVDYVFDIHSTIVKTDNFIITVGESELAKYFPLRRVVDMSGFARGVSLIENVPLGVSIEYAHTTPVERVIGQLRQGLVNLGVLAGSPNFVQQEKYVVYDVLKKSPGNKNITLENFVETQLNREFFIPILYGEGTYPDILCLKARKIW